MMSPTPTCRIISMSRTTVHLHPGVDDETLQMFNITRMDLRLNAEMKSSALVRLEDEKKREFLMRLKFAIMGRNEEIRYLAIEVMRNLMKPSEMLKAEWSAELLRMDISDDIWRCLSSCNVPFLGLCYEVLTVFSNTQDYQVNSKFLSFVTFS